MLWFIYSFYKSTNTSKKTNIKRQKRWHFKHWKTYLIHHAAVFSPSPLGNNKSLILPTNIWSSLFLTSCFLGHASVWKSTFWAPSGSPLRNQCLNPTLISVWIRCRFFLIVFLWTQHCKFDVGPNIIFC